jgi:hypothetical protein
VVHETERHPLTRVWAILFALWAVWRLQYPAAAIAATVRRQIAFFNSLTFVVWLSLELLIVGGLIIGAVCLWQSSRFAEPLVKGLLALGVLEALLSFARSGAATGLIQLFVILLLCLPPLLIAQRARA